jgi:hypothetical protein
MIEFTDVQTWGPHHPVGVAIGSFTTVIVIPVMDLKDAP